MKLTSLVPLLVACGGTTGATVKNTNPDPTALPPLYAGLFIEGKQWKLPAELISSGDDGSGTMKKSTDKGTVTCVVSAVTALDGGVKTADLSCNGEGIELPAAPSGTLVGTPKGLWQVDGVFDGNVAGLDPKHMLFAATPKAGKIDTKDPENDCFGSAISVAAHGASWCVTSSIWGGDEGGWTLCLRDGAITGGAGYFAGGSTRDAYFGDVPRH